MGKNRRFFGTYIIKVGVWRWHWGGWTATTYKTPVFNLLSDDCFRRCWPVWRCRPAASSRTARRPWPVLRGSPPAVESMCRSHSAEQRKNMKLQRTKFNSHLRTYSHFGPVQVLTNYSILFKAADIQSTLNTCWPAHFSWEISFWSVE